MSFVLAVYLPRDDAIAMFERIAEKIDGIFSVSPSVTSDICGDFNIHNKEWLVHWRWERILTGFLYNVLVHQNCRCLPATTVSYYPLRPVPQPMSWLYSAEVLPLHFCKLFPDFCQGWCKSKDFLRCAFS